jgi:RNA-splicing ligase RtcB
MQHEICEALNIKRKYILDEFCTVHNYVDTEARVVRKGSIRLLKDELAVIPVSMAYGSLIVKGKGNEEYNFSGPHGAGRLMSRSAAKETLKMEDFKKSMEGIYTTSVSTSTIDEAPMAYKPAEDILENIKDLCEVVSIIKPVWNVKAGEE